MVKVSREKKQETREKLIRAAVEVICRKGYADATMREIAREAGVGDATIYSYFPAKERLLYGYFEERIQAALADLRAAPDFGDYTFQEKLQAFLEAHLAQVLGDREFVEEGLRLAFITPLGRLSEAAEARSLVIDAVHEFLAAAIESGEFEPPPVQGFVAGMFWEYYLGVMIYWLRDRSDDYANTSQLIDGSLNLMTSVLKSDVLPRISDLFMFFVRNHMYGALELLGGALDSKPNGGEARRV